MEFATYNAFSAGAAHPSVLKMSSILAASKPLPPSPEQVAAAVHPSVLASAALSNAQLDAVTLAAIKHAAGYGFLVADSTGCGKGRTAMGIAANWLLMTKTKRVLYLSVKNVALDFFRDFGALKPLFDGLKASNIEKLKELPDSGVVFCAYDRFNTSTIKFEAIMEWVATGGAVVMDESHTVSNLDCTRGKYANRLVEAVLEKPKCSITFLSATFASKINDLPLYAKPLGLVSRKAGDGAPFSSIGWLREKLGGRSETLGYFEAVASELSNRGSMIGRQLALDGVEYETACVPISAEHEAIHDAVSHVWQKILATDVAQRNANHVQAAGLRLFKSLALCGKVDETARLAKETLARGHQVVISLISTGEAASTRSAANDLGDDDSSTACLLDTILLLLGHLEKCIPEGDVISGAVLEQLRCDASAIPNLYTVAPLDLLKHELGGAAAVAELTGRSHFVEKVHAVAAPPVSDCPPVSHNFLDDDSDDDDDLPPPKPPASPAKPPKPRFLARKRDKKTENVNDERAAFQAGTKKIALLSQACDTGTSLHADGPDAARRVQILFELPWSSSRAMQQLGRTHRAGQSSAPLYLLIGANGPEKRFVATVAARLSTLGALCAGDRSSSTKLDLGSCAGAEESVPADELLGSHSNKARRDLTSDLKHAKDDESKALYEAIVSVGAHYYSANDARPFLNRILQLPSKVGNAIFERYVGVLEGTIQLARARGGGLAEPTLAVDLSPDSRFVEQQRVDLTKAVNRPLAIADGTARPLMVRAIDENLAFGWAEATAFRNKLIADGVPERCVYFAGFRSSVHLVHVRTHTKTFRRYYPNCRLAETVDVDCLPPPISSLDKAAEWWCGAWLQSDAIRTHFVAELPALWVIGASFGNSRRVARITEKDGSTTVGIELDRDVVVDVLEGKKRMSTSGTSRASGASGASTSSTASDSGSVSSSKGVKRLAEVSPEELRIAMEE